MNQIDMARKVIDFKLDVAERYIEQKLLPLLDIISLRKAIKKPFTEWTPEQVQMAIELYGEEKVRLRMAKDVDKKVSDLEAEVEAMEGKANG